MEKMCHLRNKCPPKVIPWRLGLPMDISIEGLFSFLSVPIPHLVHIQLYHFVRILIVLACAVMLLPRYRLYDFFDTCPARRMHWLCWPWHKIVHDMRWSRCFAALHCNDCLLFWSPKLTALTQARVKLQTKQTLTLTKSCIHLWCWKVNVWIVTARCRASSAPIWIPNKHVNAPLGWTL